MSNEGGMDYGYVDREIASLRSELQAEINQLRRWTEHEILRLEREMREVGEMIVDAINRQTTAVVAEVAASTIMMERTKRQIEEEAARTIAKLEIQTESALQIEVGKKFADATSLKGKLDAFVGDIKSRFDKSIANVVINRELYNLNFSKITEEYENKIKTIGEHIFQVKLEDIAPAVKAAAVPYESAHSLPIEMDLKRLAARSENLEETLQLLRSSRLDEVVNSLETIESSLQTFDAGPQRPGAQVRLSVDGLVTTSALATQLLVGKQAAAVVGAAPVALSSVDTSLEAFGSARNATKVASQMEGRRFRQATPAEVAELERAAGELLKKQQISAEAQNLFADFLRSGNLKVLEA